MLSDQRPDPYREVRRKPGSSNWWITHPKNTYNPSEGQRPPRDPISPRSSVVYPSARLRIVGVGKDEVQQPCTVPAGPCLFGLCLDVNDAGSADVAVVC